MRDPRRQHSRVDSAHAEFLALYDRCATRVLVFHTRRVVDPEIAKDLWAETFAAAYQGWGRLRASTEAEEEAWVFGIARRLLARYYRRGYSERRAMHRAGLERPDLPDDDIERLAALADLAERRERLRHGLAHLSDTERLAVSLRFIDGLAYDEIAARLGVSEQTARMRVSRGLRRLRHLLEDAHE